MTSLLESASDDEAEASQHFSESASVIRTDAGSGVPFLSEACHAEADGELHESAEVITTNVT